MKSNESDGQCVFGNRLGKVTGWFFIDKKVYPAKVKISEEK